MGWVHPSLNPIKTRRLLPFLFFQPPKQKKPRFRQSLSSLSSADPRPQPPASRVCCQLYFTLSTAPATILLLSLLSAYCFYSSSFCYTLSPSPFSGFMSFPIFRGRTSQIHHPTKR